MICKYVFETLLAERWNLWYPKDHASLESTAGALKNSFLSHGHLSWGMNELRLLATPQFGLQCTLIG